MRDIIKLYREHIGDADPDIEALPVSGSDRKYFRLSGVEGSVIGTIGSSREENEAFFYLTGEFSKKRLNVPKLLAISEDRYSYIQQDLGDNTLFNEIERGRSSGVFSDRERLLLNRCIYLLADLHFIGGEGLDFSNCYPSPAFNIRSVIWDLNYFKYCFLKTTGIDFKEDLLEDSFAQFASVLTEDSSDSFMYRDFQSRNVMIHEDKLYFIDYQGGRRGPYHYDIASFLWQARAGLSEELRYELIETYIESARRYIEIDRDIFYSKIYHFALFRILQTLGSYGFRGYMENKSHFLKSIPYAKANLRRLLELDIFDDSNTKYPYLCNLLRRMNDNIRPPIFCKEEVSQLTVKIYSFSYKKRGLPKCDDSNGGGYIFDCRAIHNPGKYLEYRSLNGLDQSVIRFIESSNEMSVFLKSVKELADIHIRKYIERGFTDLSFGFGCTGGQHRSVYAAHHFAKEIESRYPIKVEIDHLELFPKSVILAAGLGTRLRPITDTIPKALVAVDGKPMIEWTIENLIKRGCRNLVITVHHFADQIIDFVKSKNNFGIDIEFSQERERLLETGGGVKNARKFLKGENHFLVHNCDIFSNVDLKKLYIAHSTAFLSDNRVATLVVSRRESSRFLLFDEKARLVGWMNSKTGEIKSPYTAIVSGEIAIDTLTMYAFAGIYMLSSDIFDLMESYEPSDETPFSIIDLFLSICCTRDIVAYIPDSPEIRDIGVL